MHKTGLVRISVPKIWPNWEPAFPTFSHDDDLSAVIILIPDISLTYNLSVMKFRADEQPLGYSSNAFYFVDED